MRSNHTLSVVALVTALGLVWIADAQVGAGGGGGGQGGGATTSGSPASPASGPHAMPGGAPGVQREPLNAAPEDAVGSGNAMGGGGDGDATGGDAGRTTMMSDDEIHQACMMKADPEDCRTRMREGVTDPSIERDPP